MPSRPGKLRRQSRGPELSTTDAPICVETVDDLQGAAKFERSEEGIDRESGMPAKIWLGYVVPKRHARRAVTRNLLRREIRAAVAARWATLPGGLWVVRLHAGFDRSRFPSAASEPLRQAARLELACLVDRCVEPSPRRSDVVRAEPS